MNDFTEMAHLQLFNNGLNINPIPLEFSQEMTTTKILASMQAKINEIIDFRNQSVKDSNNYTDSQIAILDQKITDLKTYLTNEVNDLVTSPIFAESIKNWVSIDIGEIATFPVFSLDNEGHFCCSMPDTWRSVHFGSTLIGELTLDY